MQDKRLMYAKEDLEGMETLDPANWDDTRALMHTMVDDAVDFLSSVRERPIWQDMPTSVEDNFSKPLPSEPQAMNDVYEEFQETILPYNMGTIHPGFWSWYMGGGTISGVIGDFWASLMNPNGGGANHAANKVENQVIDWMKEIMGFPKDSSGLLVSGGSMANFVGLAVARNAHAGYDIRKEGLCAEQSKGRMTVYASTEVHSCNQKAVELLGLGSDSLRKIPVNADYSINMELLRDKIKEDKNAGHKPICIIATAGTVNTGAIDDLDGIADLCNKESLWFHVDGAIGALAMLSDKVRPLIQGLSQADSIAIDLHKWLHMPFEAACTLIKDSEVHKNTFSLIPEYLAKKSRGLASGDTWFSEYGLQLSRRFKALKIWMSIKNHGADRFGRMITRNVEQAKYVGKKVESHAYFELIAPIGMDIVCFRYNPGGLSNEHLNQINEEIKIQIEEMGLAAPGYTTLNEIYCLRLAICNHRTTNQDFDQFLESVLEIGNKLKADII